MYKYIFFFHNFIEKKQNKKDDIQEPDEILGNGYSTKQDICKLVLSILLKCYYFNVYSVKRN